MLLHLRPKANMKRKGWRQWQGVDQDPWLRITWWFGRPRFVFIEFDCSQAGLDPRIYFDRGDGYDEDSGHDLQHVHTGIYVVDLASMPDVKRLRFDPASAPCTFWLRVSTAHSVPAAVKKIAKLTRQWYARRVTPPVCQVISHGDHAGNELARYRMRLTLGQNAAAHFAHATALGLADESAHAADLAGNVPLISIVTPVYNTPPAYLDELRDSLERQKARNFEWILSDDGSARAETLQWLERHSGKDWIRIVRDARNGGIARAINSGLAHARGEWVCTVDHDDCLSPAAIHMLNHTLKQHSGAQFIYTDEISADAALKPRLYFLKPAFDDVLLSGVNYINHLSLFRRDRLMACGGLRDGFSGSQDYDLLLRYLSGLKASGIIHLPYPAYIWRRDGKSYSAKHLATATASARAALSQAYGARHPDVIAEKAGNSDLHRLRLDACVSNWPRVSIVIPNRDSYEMISRLCEDLHKRTYYPDIELIIIDNGSTDARVLDLYRQLPQRFARCQTLVEPAPFNFSAQVNKGMMLAGGGAVLLLNNDIEIREPGWLREMVSCLSYDKTGIVGAKLLYPDNTLQHAGVIVGLSNYAGHWFERAKPGWYGPMGRLAVRQTMSAVTGACMLISRPCLDATGVFDENNFAIAYNDIDFCLRAGAKGYRTVWTPFAELIHHESVSRGSDASGENLERFRREQAALLARHGTDRFEDRAFNPWYTRGHSHPKLAYLDALPQSRHVLQD
ncbi:MAG: glycosyltransferase [Alphaproteobacteria bacterium]|nr:glycosyltransferase [Alphaproteobacteria bacterium]